MLYYMYGKDADTTQWQELRRGGAGDGGRLRAELSEPYTSCKPSVAWRLGVAPDILALYAMEFSHTDTETF